MKNIIVLQRILPHYREGFFKKLRERFPGTSVFYGQPYRNESLRNTDLTGVDGFTFSKNIYLSNDGKLFFSRIYRKLKQYKPDIVISVFNVGNVNIYILFVLRKFLKFKVILWSFGYDPERGFNPGKRFADKVRLYLSQNADAVIFYWKTGRDEVAKYSEKTDHYFIAPNTLDTDKLIALKESFDLTGKERIKQELCAEEQFQFVYVGRLLEDKQVDLLLRAFSILEKTIFNVRLNIIGDGPEKENLLKRAKDLELKNIHFMGEITNEEQTGKWIYISDAFVMPGRLGLSVVHSFCFAIPVISQKKEKYFHGEGIGYLRDGENGLLVEDGDVNQLAQRMSEIITDKILSEALKQNAFNTVLKECSIDQMINGFKNAVDYASSKE